MPVKILRVTQTAAPYFLVLFSAIAIPTLIMRLLGGIVGHDAADYVQCLEFDD